MSNTQEQIIVESITQYGVKVNGKAVNLSPNLKKSGITPAHFQVGGTYLVEIFTGSQGGRYINSFAPISAPVALVVPALPPPPPALPQTSLPATPAPGGVPPVAPAVPLNKAGTPRGPADDSDKMTKQEWRDKDLRTHFIALSKSTLESPGWGQACVGKNPADRLVAYDEIYDHAVEKFLATCQAHGVGY